MINVNIKVYRDEILDKIKKGGVKSLTHVEREFLDLHKEDKEREYFDKISKTCHAKNIDADFTLEKSEICDTQTNHWGNLRIGDMECYGCIVYIDDEIWITDFEFDDEKNDWILIQGREEEYEEFIEETIKEIYNFYTT